MRAVRNTDQGIEVVLYQPMGPILQVIDPETGSVIATEELNDNDFDRRIARSIDIWTDREEGKIVVRTPDGTVVFEAEAPSSYWIEYGEAGPNGTWSIVDSEGRLAVLDIGGTPRLVDDNVRSWMSVAWEPISG